MNDNFNNTDFNTFYEENTTANTEPVVSEPYRYKYENGEKRENPNASGYYNYNYSYGNTASHVTMEVPKKSKKRPLLKAVKWVAGAACFGIIAGAAFLGTSYIASEVFGIT